jgi:type I restriction enzyme M protein
MSRRPRNTEVDSYVFIKQQLKALGWDARNPTRNAGGQVYTQNECLDFEEFKEHLGLERPENIVKLTETSYWLIEAKRNREQIDQALAEAEEYANKINASQHVKVVLISGIAGNDSDRYIVRNKFLQNGVFRPVTLNGQEASGLVTPQLARILLESQQAAVADVPVDERAFLASAERINGFLHDGGINKNVRARVMAALLLSLVGDTQPNVDAEPLVLIRDINSRAQTVLQQNRKEQFIDFVRISAPTSADNHINFKGALVKTLRELNNLNIRSAMNSGTDVLGKFYEVFLKYGNGAKEIGIVLTPRHVTRYAADILGVSLTDIVLDPTCGTGGFLVAAYDQVRRTASEEQINVFKQNNIFGIEEDPEVVALAIVNMIFRGDGKNNIIEGNIFRKRLDATTNRLGATARFIEQADSEEDSRPVTKILMNPPFAKRQEDHKEYRFVQRALDLMAHGQLLFSVLPTSVMFEEGGEKTWRADRLLAENTLVSVITLPPELFYPVGVHTLGIIVRRGIPHPEGRKVLWVRAVHDGYTKLKGKRLETPGERNDLQTIRNVHKAFIADLEGKYEVASTPELYKAAPIDRADTLLELVPEAYIDSREYMLHEIKSSVDKLIRSAIAFLFTNRMEKGIPSPSAENAQTIDTSPTFAPALVGDLFDVVSGQYHNATNLDAGSTPLVSCGEYDNGVNGFSKPDMGARLSANLLTVAYNGQPFTAKFHPYTFMAKDDVAVCTGKKDVPLETVLFAGAMFNLESWRFSYGRKCFRAKLRRSTIPMPQTKAGAIDHDAIDHEWIKKVIHEHPYWSYLSTQIEEATKMHAALEVERLADAALPPITEQGALTLDALMENSAEK